MRPLIVAVVCSVAASPAFAFAEPTEHRLSVPDLCRALEARTINTTDRIAARATFLVDMRHGNFIQPEGDCRRGIVFGIAPGSQAAAAWEKLERTMLGLDLGRKPKTVYLVLDNVVADLHGRAVCPLDIAQRCEIEIDHLSKVTLPTLDQ